MLNPFVFLRDLFLAPAKLLNDSKFLKASNFFFLGFLVFLVLFTIGISLLVKIPIAGINRDYNDFFEYGFIYRLYPWSALVSVPVFLLFYSFYPGNIKSSFGTDFRLAILTAIQGMALYFIFILIFRLPFFSFKAFTWNYVMMLTVISFFQVYLFYSSLPMNTSKWSIPVIVIMNLIMNFLCLSVTKGIISVL